MDVVREIMQADRRLLPVTEQRSPPGQRIKYTKYSNPDFDIVVYDNPRLMHMVIDKRDPSKHVIYNGLHTAYAALYHGGAAVS
jgi:hypothetical protein